MNAIDTSTDIGIGIADASSRQAEVTTLYMDRSDETTIRWSEQTLDELEATYWDRIAPAMAADGLDPEAEAPGYAWLVDHGFRGLEYALREHHDLTLSEFFGDVVGVGEGSDGYDWGVDVETAGLLDAYAQHLLAEGVEKSTLASKRSRLAKYARAYVDHHDQGFVAVEGDATGARERARVAFESVGDELDAPSTRVRYHADVAAFYDWVVDQGMIDENPVEGLREELGWEREQASAPALDVSDVRAIVDSAETDVEEIVVTAFAGWGLRTSEVAALHREQIALEVDDPHLQIDDRRSGPETIPLVVGADALADRLAELDGGDWNGYLFPSSRSASGHVTDDTVRTWFQDVARRAGVDVDGRVPTPTMARRFWLSAAGDGDEWGTEGRELLRERLADAFE